MAARALELWYMIGVLEMRKHRFAIYFTWNDGTEDSFNVDSKEVRDLNIKNMIERNEFKSISYSRIYANGEYGSKTKVL